MSTTAAPRRIPLNILDHIRVAAPCPKRWDELTAVQDGIGVAGGDDAVRHCGDCGLNVYNFAGLTREQSLEILERHAADGARLCGAVYKRRDGTLLTWDCPSGRAAARRRLATIASRMLGAGLLLVSGTLAYAATQGGAWHPRARMLAPVRGGADWLRDKADVLLGRPRGVLMGAIAMPRIPPNVPKESESLFYTSIWDR